MRHFGEREPASHKRHDTDTIFWSPSGSRLWSRLEPLLDEFHPSSCAWDRDFVVLILISSAAGVRNFCWHASCSLLGNQRVWFLIPWLLLRVLECDNLTSATRWSSSSERMVLEGETGGRVLDRIPNWSHGNFALGLELRRVQGECRPESSAMNEFVRLLFYQWLPQIAIVGYSLLALLIVSLIVKYLKNS